MTRTSPNAADRWHTPAVLVALAGLVAMVYWPGIAGGYVFDDFPNIVDNTNLHVGTLAWPDWLAAAFSSPASDLQRPLAMLTFAANHYFTGLDPEAMKLTNIALHAANALLVLGLVRQLLAMAPLTGIANTRREWAARFVAAAWALHPINLMAVLLVVQRMEVLAHTFVFAGLWLYLLGRQRQACGRNGWLLISTSLVLGSGLGALAKESAVLLPLYAFLVELCLLGFRRGGVEAGSGPRRDRRLYLLYALVLVLPAVAGVAWLLPKVMASGAWAGRDFTLGERLLTQARVVIDYLSWTLFPSLRELSLYHDDYQVSRGLLRPATTLPAMLAIGALLAFVASLRRRRPLASLGLLWFLGAQLLTATILPLELVYEHRNYFASLGICLLLADVLLLAPRTAPLQRIGVLVAVVALFAFTLTTHLRAREWSHPYRFAASEAAKHPQSPRATYALGRVLVIMGDYDPQSPHTAAAFDALELARAVPRSNILPAQALLVLAARTGRPMEDAWWRDMREKLRLGPIGPQELAALGAMTHCAEQGDCPFPQDRMMAIHMAALGQQESAELLNMYGSYVLNVLDDPELALRLWTQAAEVEPGNAQYRINLVKLLIAMGRHEQAREQISALRGLGRFGQHDNVAEELRLRLESAAQ
jgi:protein O-mannosyl-transferase